MDNLSTPAPGQLLDFSARVVVVTGAGLGIGAGIALRFAQAGAGVAVGYRTSEAAARRVVAAIEASGGRAVAIAADLTRSSEAERLIESAARQLGEIDVLINNAGTYPLTPLVEMSETDWDLVLDANLKSVFLTTRAAARQMIERGKGGAIVNIASIEGESPAPQHSHYNAAKGGVLMHTRAAALELAEHAIRVNAVSPGLIWRQGIEEQWPDGVKRWRAAAPLRRLGRAEDVADACLFLASPGARWITGVNLRVDGGVSAGAAF